jgi:putative DNA primase/helicase
MTQSNGTAAALLAVATEMRKESTKATHGNGSGSNKNKSLLPPPPFNQRFDDVATAERFLDLWGDEICYQAETRKWLVWDGIRWKQDQLEEVFNNAVEFAKGLHSPEITSSTEGKKYAQRANSHAGLNAFLVIAQKKKTVPAAAFDSHPYLINCTNGTLDLRTFELLPHDRTKLITKVVACEYDPDAEAPEFLEFLETVQPDRKIRAFLQRSIGYSLLGVVRERAFWILYGIGNNGKSIFLILFIKLLRDYASGTTANSIMARKGSQIPNDIARLKGQRFVIVPETQEDEKIDAALVKALSAGDTITARFLFGEFFDFQFTGKLWIATNNKPVITDRSKGFWDRVIVVPFAQDIPPDKVIKSDDLIANLLAEAPGIFAWAVQGCRDYFELDSLDVPAEIQNQIDSYRGEQDPIAQFLESRCVTYEQARSNSPNSYLHESDFRAANTNVYRAYQVFCDESGESPISKKKFTQDLLRRGFANGNSGGRYWKGFRLISER